jgi:hypothetical protein
MTRKKSTETESAIDKAKKTKSRKDVPKKPKPGTGGGDITTMSGGGEPPPGEED